MKKILLSLAAASLVFGTSASAEVDFKVGGQAKVYLENTAVDGGVDQFEKAGSSANIGLQLDVSADLGNGFGLGTQATFLDTWGLEKNTVATVRQDEGAGVTVTDGIFLSKLYLTKQIFNTTVKGGRQELPKSLSPLAYSEGWNIFKNTFDAIVLINSDIPKTTLVGAYVSASNGSKGTGFGKFDDLAGVTIVGNAPVAAGAYMLTAATTAIPLTTLTASYYTLDTVAVAEKVDAIWVDAKVAGDALPAGITLGLQGGQITPDAGLDSTTAFGVKLGANFGGFGISAAYTSVNDGAVAVRNVGTQEKSPLYTQQILNQGYIAHDADTFQVAASAGLGGYGTLIAKYASAEMGKKAILGANDTRTELDLIYVANAGAVDYLLAYVMNTNDSAADTSTVRAVASYGF